MLDFSIAAQRVVVLTILMDRGRSGRPAGERVIVPEQSAKGMPSMRVAVEGVVEQVMALDRGADLSTAPLIAVHRVQQSEGSPEGETRNSAKVFVELS
jgi:hypothetical protein